MVVVDSVFGAKLFGNLMGTKNKTKSDMTSVINIHINHKMAGL